MLAKAVRENKPSHSDQQWRQLNNFAKEREQFNFLMPLILEESKLHPHIEVRTHFRTKQGRTTDADIILLKDGVVKCQIELGNLWVDSFKNVTYALNPRRQALLGCSKVEIDDSFKSYYIQNGGRYDHYLRDACTENGWILFRLPPIYHMRRDDIRAIKRAIHHIFIHAEAETQYVYDSVASTRIDSAWDIIDYHDYLYALCCDLNEDGDTYYFDPSSTDFYPHTERLPRCRQVEMEVYYQMVTPVPPWTIRWLNQLEVYKELRGK